MMRSVQALVAVSLLTLGAAATASAADLNTYGGSLKDGYVAPMAQSAGLPCYLRAGIGYSWGREPSVSWEGTTFANSTMGDSGLGEVSLGCGSATGWGLRGELQYTYRGKKSFDSDLTSTFIALPPNDPAHTSVKSHALMLNAYWDLGNHRGFVPYVGAGIGIARNEMSNVYFTNSPFFNEVLGQDKTNFAWSLMAGVEYQFSNRWSMDMGYRYIDLGSAVSDNIDTGGFWNPHFKIDDLAAHEITVGVRYKFCGRGC
jgi:opacity protein-like surface antigen